MDVSKTAKLILRHANHSLCSPMIPARGLSLVHRYRLRQHPPSRGISSARISQQQAAAVAEKQSDIEESSAQQSPPTFPSSTTPPRSSRAPDASSINDRRRSGTAQENDPGGKQQQIPARFRFAGPGRGPEDARSAFPGFRQGATQGPDDPRNVHANLRRLGNNNSQKIHIENMRTPGQGGKGLTDIGDGYDRKQSAALESLVVKPDTEAPTLRMGPSLGRTVEVDGTGDLNRAFRNLDILCNRNAVKADLYRQRFHERPGLKRKRLKSVRWRRRFKADFQAVCRRVEELKRKGW